VDLLEKEFELLHLEDSNDEWDDLDLDLEGFCLMGAFLFGERKSYWAHKCKDWSQHFERLQHTGRFHCKYRMSKESLDKLVNHPSIFNQVSKLMLWTLAAARKYIMR
jgi:hypothetical protein